MSVRNAFVNARYVVRRTWRQPWLLLFYVLVYWGRTTVYSLLAGSVVAWAAGELRIAAALAIVAFGASAFNLGFAARGGMPDPPGKRR